MLQPEQQKVSPDREGKLVMANTGGSTTSSMTSTSHTLTHEPSQTSKGGKTDSSSHEASNNMEALPKTLEPSNRHTLIQPSINLYETALAHVKLLDSAASELCDEHATKLQAGKRKRVDGDVGEPLRIRKIHTAGFGVEQVWEQARRVIEALRNEVVKDVERLATDFEAMGIPPQQKPHGKDVKSVRFDDGDGSVNSEDGSDIEGGESFEDMEEGDYASEDEDTQGLVDEDDMESQAGEEEGFDVEGGIEDDYNDEDEEEEEASGVFVEDPHGLNDGFFSIDDFNKQTEFLEQQDATGDPYTGEASDEEDIDWDADPMSIPLSATSNSKKSAAAKHAGDNSEMEDSDEDGPTFGNADLNGDDDDSDAGEGVEMDVGAFGAGDNTNDIAYKDFFAPPPRKASKGERQAKYLERQARKPKAQDIEDNEAEMERAMADVRRDLFDDESERDDSENALSDVDAADPKSRRSAHERRQAKLAEEIRRLEAASVAKREWTLSGEARAADRPLNSLLEEDLDFERTGKPVPVITAEVSESIEELIKRRIIAQEFDEVIRRRPDSDNVPTGVRRGLFELDDNKAQQSLAEIYEEEHVKATNPDTYVSKADEKLKKEHQEIETLWREVCAKLDALSSWHYKPKPAAPSLTVVSDVATVAMEDAQPTTASGMAGADSMLAPQEIYKAGQDKQAVAKGEVVPSSAIPVARQEMTREEKLRRRRREKERIRKRGGLEADKRPEGKRAQQKKETLGDLKKAGVRVIGKKGEVTDLEGNKIKATSAANGGGAFKL
jgi:U3 small nucleolar RNA-associated protein MPP10